MKRTLFVVATVAATLFWAGCNPKKPQEPNPEKPTPTDSIAKDSTQRDSTHVHTKGDTVMIAVHTFGFVDYYKPNGDYNLVLVGKDKDGVEYYATFCVIPTEASFVGHFSLSEGTMRQRYCNFLPNYTPSSQSKDFLVPDIMCITVGMNGDKYDLDGRLTYEGVVYVMTATAIAGFDQRWGYEPTEKTVFNEVYTEFLGYDDIKDFKEVQVFLDNKKTFMNITFFVDSALLAGVYPISDTYKSGTVAASEGYIVSYNQDLTSYMGVYIEGSEEWKDTYYYDSGQITVSYPDSAIIDLAGEVKTHYGSEIHFSYRGKFALEEYNRQDSTQTANSAPRKHKGARR